MKVQAFFALCLGCTAFAASGCELDARLAEAESAFGRTLSVSGPVDLDVHTGSGTIEIRSGGPGVVAVQGRVWTNWDCLSGSSAEERVRRVATDPPIDQAGDMIRLGARKNMDCVSISFDVTVPARARVRAHSGSGRVAVNGIEGPVEASAGSGQIRIASIEGDAKAATGSGSIEVDGASSVTASAGSGSIRVAAVQGDVDVHTGSGRVTVSQSARGATAVTTGSGGISVSDARGSLRLHAASGSIVVDGEPVGPWQLRTASGSVTLRVPSGAAFDLDVHSNSGHISTDHEITAGGSVERGRLRGQARGGGPRVEVSTASGSIRIQ